MIENCKIIAESQSVFAGSKITSYLSFLLNNGEEIFSNGKSRIGFKDFEVLISGSGKVTKKNKRELEISSMFNAYQNPFIHIDIRLIDRPEIGDRISIPIHFNGNYILENFVKNGRKGKRGGHGVKGRNGFNHDSNYADGDTGRDGASGINGENGSPGSDGENIDVFISLVEFPRDNTQLMRIESCYEGGSCYVRFLEKTGTMTINSIGGNGGNGGRGGNGGAAGKGGEGSYRIAINNDTNLGDGYGGDGGNGGDGGCGGDGGRGGDGGHVTLHFGPNTLFFKNNIIVNNSGGVGGKGGFGGTGGAFGSFGRGGSGNGSSGLKGSKGRRGDDGLNGLNGKIIFR